MKVTELFIKRKHGAPLKPVSSIAGTTTGIEGGVECAPFRQALIASPPIMLERGLRPGDLRENIVIDSADLYELPSGTAVKIGEALLL